MKNDLKYKWRFKEYDYIKITELWKMKQKQ